MTDKLLHDTNSKYDWQITAKEGFTDAVSLLLEFNASVDAVNDQGMSALCFAASEGHIDVMKMLCRKNARVCIILKKSYYWLLRLHLGYFYILVYLLKLWLVFGCNLLEKETKN
jgi:hypothetical protein